MDDFARRAALFIALSTAIAPWAHAQEPEKCQPQQLMEQVRQGFVPDMLGCEVKPTLTALGQINVAIKAGEIAGPPPRGRIVSQSPNPGTTRTPNTAIEVGYSDGRERANITARMTLETPGPYHAGDEVKYWVVVGNRSSIPVPFVNVEMQLQNLTITRVNPTFERACHAMPCMMESAPPDSNTSFFVYARIGDGPRFSSQVTARPRQPDADLSDNSFRILSDVERVATATTPAQADVSVSTTGDPNGEHRPGEHVTYRITIHNAGPQPATNVTVQAAWKNMQADSVTGDCAAFPCTIPSIAAADDASVIITATLGSAGVFSNLLTVAAAEDSNRDNNIVSHEGLIVSPTPTPTPTPTRRRSADISVVRMEGLNDRVHPDDHVPIIFTVHNEGPSDATRVQVNVSGNNVDLESSGALCEDPPCTIRARSDVTFTLEASFGDTGPFQGRVEFLAAEQDPDRDNNAFSFAGRVVSPIPWIWITCGGIALLGAGATATHLMRRQRWRDIVKITPSLDPSGSSSAGSLSKAAPPLGISSWIEPGSAMPKTQIPVTPEKV